jgi:membrane-associated phospholipid phosphatase
MPNLLPDFVHRRLDPTERYGLRLTLFVLSLSLAGIPFALLLIQVSSRGAIVRHDESVSQALFTLKAQFPVLAKAFNLISFLGFPPWFWFLIGGASIYLWVKGLRRLVAFLLSTTIGGSIVNTIVKQAVNRPRPTFRDPGAITFETGKSFPSGHSMSSTIAYGALVLIFLPLIPKRWRVPALIGTVLLVLLIGIARLGLGVHYLSDVLGGYVLGLAWLIASTAAFSIWRVERGGSPVEPLAGVEPEAAPTIKPGRKA